MSLKETCLKLEREIEHEFSPTEEPLTFSKAFSVYNLLEEYVTTRIVYSFSKLFRK
jgi:hypothetical protein